MSTWSHCVHIHWYINIWYKYQFEWESLGNVLTDRFTVTCGYFKTITWKASICFVMAPKSRYLKSVNHKIVTWNTNRPRRLHITIFFNLLFYISPFCDVLAPRERGRNQTCYRKCWSKLLLTKQTWFIFFSILWHKSEFSYIIISCNYIKSYLIPTNSTKNLKIV
jgi:hypothetical protein